MFNILPLYYCEKGDELFVSSSPKEIASQIPGLTINKRFILENILFNYQLFNQSFYNEINLLAANHYIRINKKVVSFQKHTTIEDLFFANPRHWRKSAGILANLFIESANQYFPEKPFTTSLTGGFDGRTLVSCGLYYGKRFSTYSFGTAESEDIKIAGDLSKKAGLVFEKVTLDYDYIHNNSFINGLEFISGAFGGAGFARAHYLFAAKQLAKKYGIMVTGNFGSEVFKAPNSPGILISQNLFNLFNARNYSKAIIELENSPELWWINRESFKMEWESLKDDLRKIPCFTYENKGLTKNMQFYIFVFEEVFRKYFGAEMVNQYKFLINRTPYLDFNFIKNLLGTELAGVHSDFFTKNPLSHFKGQVTYAHIIKKTYPSFGKELTDKGYCPDDLIRLTGKVRIAGSYIKKRIKRNSRLVSDPFAVNAAFSFNRSFWKEMNIDKEIFNVPELKDRIEKDSNIDNLIMVLSQAWFYNQNLLRYDVFKNLGPEC